MVYAGKDEYGLAIDNYNFAIELANNNAIVYYLRGNYVAIIEEYDLAISDYDLAINLGMDIASIYNNRGISRVDKRITTQL